jgi:hypothetical protein
VTSYSQWQDSAEKESNFFCRYTLHKELLLPISSDSLIIDYSMRQRCCGKRIFVVPVVGYYDDFNNNKWGGLYIQLPGLDRVWRNKNGNIRLFSVSPHDITYEEAMEGFVEDVKQLHKGFFIWHAGLKEEVYVTGGLLCLIADMPQVCEFTALRYQVLLLHFHYLTVFRRINWHVAKNPMQTVLVDDVLYQQQILVIQLPIIHNEQGVILSSK